MSSPRDESSENMFYDLDDDLRRHNLFSKEEDEKLKNVIEKFYHNDMRKVNWSFVSSMMSNKNKRQCKDRYINYLRDGLNNDIFTPEENYLLLCKVEEFGHKWRMISKFFINRTDIMIKAQYRKLLRRNATKENVRFMVIEKPRKKYPRSAVNTGTQNESETDKYELNDDHSFPIDDMIINIDLLLDPVNDLDNFDEFNHFYAC